LRTLSDEVRLFARMSIFGLVVGGAYGLLTGERAGAVLLLAFGLASGLAALAVYLGSGRGRRREGPPAASPAPRPKASRRTVPARSLVRIQ